MILLIFLLFLLFRLLFYALCFSPKCRICTLEKRVVQYLHFGILFTSVRPIKVVEHLYKNLVLFFVSFQASIVLGGRIRYS